MTLEQYQPITRTIILTWIREGVNHDEAKREAIRSHRQNGNVGLARNKVELQVSGSHLRRRSESIQQVECFVVRNQAFTQDTEELTNAT